MRRILVGLVGLTLAAGGMASVPVGVSSAAGVPPWVLHVQHYPGGISAGVRAMISDDVGNARARYGAAAALAGGCPNLSRGGGVEVGQLGEVPVSIVSGQSAGRA